MPRLRNHIIFEQGLTYQCLCTSKHGELKQLCSCTNYQKSLILSRVIAGGEAPDVVGVGFQHSM
jgi:hypothetical protein